MILAGAMILQRSGLNSPFDMVRAIFRAMNGFDPDQPPPAPTREDQEVAVMREWERRASEEAKNRHNFEVDRDRKKRP